MKNIETRFFGIIPARYASTRFPGKPLVNIDGKSMIQRVFDQALACGKFTSVVVATDNKLIYDHVKAFGGIAVMTAESHPSGTDRCFEAASLINADFDISKDDVIVNIQGDEPYIHPEQISELLGCFSDERVQIATQAKLITDADRIFDPNAVKVVFDENHQALLFSRSPIPYIRNLESSQWVSKNCFYKHIGIYAYRMGILEQLVKLSPSRLEKLESLEQLRWIESGFRIKVMLTGYESPSIDTPEDLNKLMDVKK